MKKLLASSLVGSLIALSSFGVAIAASPTLMVTGSAMPFSTLTVSGNNFAPNEKVHIMLNTSSADATADGGGNFGGVSLPVPNLSAGTYIVLAFGQTSGTVAFQYVYVGGLFPLASPSSWYIMPGSTITWTGSGFAPNETITITQSASSTSFTTDGSGAFSAAGASVVPFALHNSVATYTLTSSISGVNTAYHVGVGNLYPFANPSTWYALPGTHVTFTGAGFAGGEGVSVFLGGSAAGGGASSTPVAHIATDSTGAFTSTGDVTLPFHTPSPVTYQLIGDMSGATVNAPITLAQFYPTLSPSSYYSAPGGFISLAGSGFIPNEVIDVTVGASTSTTHATTDGSGAFTGLSLHLPPTANTMLTISGTGETSGAHTSFVMAIGAYYAWITLDNYWAQGGSPLSIFGHNFAGGETVNIVSGANSLGSATAANDGSFTASVSVPFVMPGAATITATGASSGASADANMTVAPVYTNLQFGQYAGAPGAAIEIIGHNYLPNEPIIVTTDRTGSTTVASFSADATGSFDDSSYLVPADFTEGNLTVTVSGQHSFSPKSIVYYLTGI